MPASEGIGERRQWFAPARFARSGAGQATVAVRYQRMKWQVYPPGFFLR